MGLFDVFKKKDCEICGKEVGLFGYKKLEDGEICKDCVKLLSPWFDDRRHSTVEQIKSQLVYRQENQKQLATFRPAVNCGEWYELKAELVNGVPSRFVVAQTDDYLEENADLISFSQVTSFNIDIQDSYRELKYSNSEGEMVSYTPRRYEYSYDFYAKINVNHPWFDDIRFRLNRNTLELETVSQGFSIFTASAGFDPMHYPEYRQYKALCDELEALFRAGMQGQVLAGASGYVAQTMPAAPIYAAPAAAPVNTAPVAPAAPAQPAAPKFCQNCGAPVSGGKFCQSCGSPL